MCTWQLRMVASAASWAAGVTPAQRAGFTVSGTSGSAALMSRALLTTQMSVQRPQSSMESIGGGAVLGGEPVREPGGAERGLLEDARVALGANGLEGGDEIPAVRAADAVGNRKVTALLGFGVVGAVGVEGEDDGAVEGCGALGYRVDDGLGLGAAERAVDEIMLHVDDDEVVAGHGGFLCGWWIRIVPTIVGEHVCLRAPDRHLAILAKRSIVDD